MGRYVRANRNLWDEWTDLHAKSEEYDVGGFLRNRENRLNPVERGELPDVAGRRRD